MEELFYLFLKKYTYITERSSKSDTSLSKSDTSIPCVVKLVSLLDERSVIYVYFFKTNKKTPGLEQDFINHLTNESLFSKKRVSLKIVYRLTYKS